MTSVFGILWFPEVHALYTATGTVTCRGGITGLPYRCMAGPEQTARRKVMQADAHNPSICNFFRNGVAVEAS
jgi:hypothetical protein